MIEEVQLQAPQEGQQLLVEVSGKSMQQLNLASGSAEYQVTLPTQLIHPGLNLAYSYKESIIPLFVSKCKTSSRRQLTFEVSFYVVYQCMILFPFV